MGIMCKICGAENTDDTRFCVSCGNPLENGYTQMQGYDANMQANQMAAQPVNQVNSASQKNGMFVSDDEYVVATLRNGLVANIMSGEGLRHENAILTNRRIYYNHSTGWINVEREEEKVDVADVTGTKILDHNPRGWLLLAVLAIVVAMMIGCDIIMAIGMALVPVIIYFLSVRKHFRIEYSGGFIYFSIRNYNMRTVREFQKAIYMVKDQMR